MLPCLGVDPALTGAAVLLSPDEAPTATLAVFWKPVQRNRSRRWMITAWSIHQPSKVSKTTVGTLGAIGCAITLLVKVRGASSVELGAEQAVVGRAVDTSIVVARNAGAIVGPIEEIATGHDAAWVKGTDWRRPILGLTGRPTREESKAASLRFMPDRVKNLAIILDLLGRHDDLTDAAGVAEWRRLVLKDPSLLTVGKRKRRKRQGKTL